MVYIKQFVFNPFQENTFVLYDDTKACIIIDPGCSNSEEKLFLKNFILDQGLQVSKLIFTHGHFDHLCGASFISDTFQIEPSCHEDEVKLVMQSAATGTMFGFEVEVPPKPKDFLKENEPLKFGDTTLKIIHTPGHSEGSISLFCEKHKFVIVGDVLFEGSIGRTDLPGGSFEVLMDSILNKLLPLGDEVKVYPGHGPPTTIGEERISNPFITGG